MEIKLSRNNDHDGVSHGLKCSQNEIVSVKDCCWMQALKTETIQFLVGLLETGLEAVDNMAATKAQIVKALKAMQLSIKYGDQVRKQLKRSFSLHFCFAVILFNYIVFWFTCYRSGWIFQTFLFGENSGDYIYFCCY